MFGQRAGYPAENALDGDHTTYQSTGSGSGKRFWKVVFDQRILIYRIKIVPRACCSFRVDNLDVKTTVINSGSRVNTICANTGTLGDEKTLDCNEYADELILIRLTSSVGPLQIADVYIYGTTCFM